MPPIKKQKDKAIVTTVSAGKLIGSLEGDKVKLTDESGNSAYVIVVDLKDSISIVHVIDSVFFSR